MEFYQSCVVIPPTPGDGTKKYAGISVVKHSSFPAHFAYERNENIVSPEHNGKSQISLCFRIKQINFCLNLGKTANTGPATEKKSAAVTRRPPKHKRKVIRVRLPAGIICHKQITKKSS